MVSNKQTIKILFLGDIVGKPGRFAVRDFLADLQKKDSMPLYERCI